MSHRTSGRRAAMARVAGLFGWSPERAQAATGARVRRPPPPAELVNVFEFEEVALTALPGTAFEAIAGSNRAAFDRMTFRPRMMVPTVDLDLTVDLFGHRHFAPIVVGPVAAQRQYHPDGELATVRGASAANAGVVVTSRSSVALEDLAAAAATPLWYSVYGGLADAGQVRAAVAAGCRAVCITAGGPHDLPARGASDPRVDWTAVDRIRAGLEVPVLIKGVMTPEDARRAIERGVQGIVVSDHGSGTAGGLAPIEVLASIADAVEGRAAVLIDGGFRRGTDILKALVLGARAVLLARPVMWGLAAYGAEGVQLVIEMLQTDLARNMASLGAPTLASLTRSLVRIHSS
jgi:4-hydroxymandelate oxidase